MNNNEATYTLPEGWIWTTIGELLILEYGKSLPQKLRIENGKYSVYGSNGKVGTHNDYLIEGPIIILGRKGSVGAVHFETNKCWPIDTTYYITSIKSLNQKFTYFLFKNLRLEKLDSSTAIPGINRNSVYEIKIGLPPLSEQYRIVSKIEELFSKLDHAEEGLKKAQKQIEVYGQALLKSAFEGKLTEKWREENNSLKNNKWEHVTIGDYSKFIGSGSTPKGGRSIYLSEGIPFIRSQNIHVNSFLQNDLVFISKEINENMSRTQTQPYDVLLNITGASIGRCAYIPDKLPVGNVNQHVCIIRVREEKVFYKYLTYYLNSPEAQVIINRINSGATREALTLGQIKNFTFTLCPLEEQYQIVQDLESKLTLIENLENSISLSFHRIKTYRQAILKKAFEGKLIDQSQSDEPADILVERILNEKKNYSEKTIQNSTAKNKIMKNRTLSETLDENFIGKEFSFDEIKAKTFLSYEELKNELYSLLDEGKFLETVFNEKLQKIQFKLKS